MTAARVRSQAGRPARSHARAHENVSRVPKDPIIPALCGRLPAGGGGAALKNQVEWVATPAALRALVDRLASDEVIALDVETALDFNTLCLIQIATPARNYIIDPFAAGDLAPLRTVLGSSRPAKVIHNATFERRVLAAVGIELKGVFDTLTISRTLRGPDVLGGHGLAMVCERELGIVLDKGEQTSNWSQRPLTIEQLRYAALDAEVLLDLHRVFAAQMLI